MTVENELRRRARDAIRRGKLPRTAPDRTWGGPGANTPCAVCEQFVSEADMGYELEFEGPSEPEPMHLQMHARCFAAWELEREEPERRASSLRLPSAPDTVTVVVSERDRTHSGSRK